MQWRYYGFLILNSQMGAPCNITAGLSPTKAGAKVGKFDIPNALNSTKTHSITRICPCKSLSPSPWGQRQHTEKWGHKSEGHSSKSLIYIHMYAYICAFFISKKGHIFTIFRVGAHVPSTPCFLQPCLQCVWPQ